MGNNAQAGAMINGFIGPVLSMAFFIFYFVGNFRLKVKFSYLGVSATMEEAIPGTEMNDVLFNNPIPPTLDEPRAYFLASFAFTLMATFLGLLGFVLVLLKKFVPAMGIFAVTTVFSGLAFLYFAAPLDDILGGGSWCYLDPSIPCAASITISPAFNWGPGCNIGALINHFFACVNSYMASKQEKSSGGVSMVNERGGPNNL